MDAVKQQLQTEMTSYEKLQKDCQKHLTSRQMLEAQLSENKLVDEEIKLLTDDAKVYKLIGPVLVRQSRDDAAQNVDKRLSYIQAEIKRHEDLLDDLGSKKSDSRAKIEDLQRRITGKA